MFPVQHTDEEVCSYCLTGHAPGWMEPEEPNWWLGRWLKRMGSKLGLFGEQD